MPENYQHNQKPLRNIKMLVSLLQFRSFHHTTITIFEFKTECCDVKNVNDGELYDRSERPQPRPYSWTYGRPLATGFT